MFKVNQVLRTKVPLTTDTDDSGQGVYKSVAPATRVVVTSVDHKNRKVRVKVSDPNSEYNGSKLFAAPGAFHTTKRGRPKGSTKVKESATVDAIAGHQW